MAIKHLVLGTLTAAAALALPLAGSAQSRSDSQRQNDNAAQSDNSYLRQTVQIDRTYDIPLDSGCTYHANIRGNVRPVPRSRGEQANLQRVRPDLRVAATVRCPGSTEAQIQERRVRSTGVARDEFEHLVALNASVQRQQNTGRCMYVPDVSFRNETLDLHNVRYLCPERSGRGGGPTGDRFRDSDRDRNSIRYRNDGSIRYRDDDRDRGYDRDRDLDVDVDIDRD